MGSLRGEAMAVRRNMVYSLPNTNTLTTTRRRDAGDRLSSTVNNSGVRSAYLVGGATLRHRSSSPGQGLQPVSAVTIGSEQGLKGHWGVNGWSLGQQADVLAFASDTEATSPTSERYAFRMLLTS